MSAAPAHVDPTSLSPTSRAPTPPGPTPLERCVDDVDAFIERSWSRAPALHRGAPGDFDDLLTVDDVDGVIGGSGLRLPFARMVRDGATIDPASYTYRAGVGSRPVPDLIDPGRVVDLFATGATLVLQGLHRNWPPLVRFCAELSDELGHPTQANAYLSTRANRGFELHYDIHDVFVVQVTGSKQWEVFEAPTRWPLERWASSEEARTAIESSPVDAFGLNAGDCLYLPKGTPHRAVADDTVSLHITVGVPALTRAHVLEEAVRVALDHEDLRAPLPVGAVDDPARLSDEVRATLTRFVSLAEGGLDASAVADRVHQRLRRSRAPRAQVRLATVLRLGEVDAATRLRTTGAAGATRRVGDGTVVLELPDRTLTLPDVVASAIELVVATPDFRVGDLPGLDADSQLVLARRLLREGAVEFADDTP